MKMLALGAALAATLAGPALAQAMTPAQYVATAGASDLYETQSSRMVLQSTQNPKVRSFATMMIADHAKSTAMVKAAAAKSGVKAPPPRLMPSQVEQIAELRAKSGPARDAVYLAQQKAAHGQALAVQSAYAEGGGAPALKAAAERIVPVVKHHIEMLKSL